MKRKAKAIDKPVPSQKPIESEILDNNVDFS